MTSNQQGILQFLVEKYLIGGNAQGRAGSPLGADLPELKKLVEENFD